MARKSEIKFFEQINDKVVHSKSGNITSRIIGVSEKSRTVNVGGKWYGITRFLYEFYLPDGVTDPHIPDSRDSNFPVTYGVE